MFDIVLQCSVAAKPGIREISAEVCDKLSPFGQADLMPLQQVKLHTVHNQNIESLDLTTTLPLLRQPTGALTTLVTAQQLRLHLPPMHEKDICCLLRPPYFSFLAIYHHVSITRHWASISYSDAIRHFSEACLSECAGSHGARGALWALAFHRDKAFSTCHERCEIKSIATAFLRQSLL